MLALPLPVLLAISVITSTIYTLTRGAYSKYMPTCSRNLWFFNIIQNVSCVAMILVIMRGIGKISSFTLMLGVIFGAVTAFQLLFNLKAFSEGPFTYTTVIVSLSAIIPTLSGIFFGETISPAQWGGIACMAACIILSPDPNNNSVHAKKSSLKWILFAALAACLSGTIGVLQKIHQESIYKDENVGLLVCAFSAATIISAVFLLFSPRGLDYRPKTKKGRVMPWLLPLITGLGFTFPNVINLYLSGVLPTAIMFPIVNLTPMILITVLGVIIFREKLILRRWIGVLIGILSTVLVGGVVSF